MKTLLALFYAVHILTTITLNQRGDSKTDSKTILALYRNPATFLTIILTLTTLPILR
jgi:hypothetical protein